MLTAVRTHLGALPRDSRDTLFLLAVVAWLLLPMLPRLPAWTPAMAGALLAWRAWLALRARPLPGRVWLVLLLAATLAATWATHRTLLGRDAGVTLVVALLALKTLELRARRDAFVIFFLGFFTLLANFLYSQSLAVAGAMLVGLMGLLTSLVLAQMPVGRPALAGAARTAGRMVLLGTPVMAALFLFFPRFTPLWNVPTDAMSGRSGLSSTMEVGNVAQLALDDGIAMRVRFDGDPPPRASLYFRGPVLANFDGRSWRPLYPTLGTLPPAAVAARRAPLELLGEPVRYTVTLEPNNRPWLMTLDVAGSAPEVPGAAAVPTPELQWLLAAPVTDLLRYTAESHLDWRQGPVASGRTILPEYRELPPGLNPRTLQLATELMRASPARPEDKLPLVRAALERLRTGGYSYTLEPGVYGTHTADEFWFDRKEGFCEHIASAFAVLMRGMDIPARIVTGFQGGERNNIDGFWIVRNSDAHAWVEVWIEGQGWLRIDPTSAVAPGRTGSLQRLQPAPGAFAAAVGAINPGLAALLRSTWDALNNTWNQRVLNYTQSRQLQLLRHLGFSSPSWEDLAYLLISLVVAAAAGGALWSLWDRVQHDPWLRLLSRVRARLAGRGLVLPPTHGPRQIATAAVERFGAQADALADWLLRLEAQRYARDTRDSLGRLRRDFRKLSWPG
jgi:protein-glutamine gamma-glutamyltransferase